jgi:hypothetical protein
MADDRKPSVYETGSGAARADEAAADAPGDARPGEDKRQRREKLLDEAVEETFPASDPISPA